MPNKIKQIGKFLLFFLWSNAIYGLSVYFVFTWLAKHSLLSAYFGNLVLIILGLAIDLYMYKTLQPKKFVTELKAERGAKKTYNAIQWGLGNYVSFKTTLYLFYVVILILSQVIVFHSTFLGENVSSFVMANNYSILFLIAVDMLIKQFSEDRERMKAISETLRKSLTENEEPM